MKIGDQIGSACAQLIHTINQLENEDQKNVIGSAVAQLINTTNQVSQ